MPQLKKIRLVIAAVVAFTLAAVLLPSAAVAVDPTTNSHKQTPIVFVHGFKSNSGTFSTMKRYFQDKNYGPLYFFDYRNTTEEHIKNNADRLWKYLEDQGLSDQPVSLVGHSMGGLVARKMAADHAGDLHLDKLVLLATPNNGANYTGFCLAGILPWCPDAVMDMKVNWPFVFLKNLNAQTVPHYTPQHVMTYMIEGDEMVPDPLLPNTDRRWVAKEASTYGTSEVHSSILEKTQVLDDVYAYVNPHTPPAEVDPPASVEQPPAVVEAPQEIERDGDWLVARVPAYLFDGDYRLLFVINGRHFQIGEMHAGRTRYMQYAREGDMVRLSHKIPHNSSSLEILWVDGKLGGSYTTSTSVGTWDISPEPPAAVEEPPAQVEEKPSVESLLPTEIKRLHNKLYVRLPASVFDGKNRLIFKVDGTVVGETLDGRTSNRFTHIRKDDLVRVAGQIGLKAKSLEIVLADGHLGGPTTTETRVGRWNISKDGLVPIK